MTANDEGDEPLYGSINHIVRPGPIATSAMFARSELPEFSPVDEFLRNSVAINRLAASAEMSPTLASVTVLGYVSAVESYFRTLTRRLVVLDADVRKSFEGEKLTYAAALYHRSDMLPDALLEDTVFSDGDQVRVLYKQLSRAKKVEIGVDAALTAYAKICTIRHCCVHRFGRLGVRNAVQLGLEEHKTLLEHAFAPTLGDLENIATAAHNLVLEFNRSLYRRTLLRLADPRPGIGGGWRWNLRSDRRRFVAYYDLFAIREAQPRSPGVEEVYASYRERHRPGQEARRRLASRGSSPSA